MGEKITFTGNIIFFIAALVGLICIRIFYVLPAPRPTDNQIIEFLDTIAADYYFFDPEAIPTGFTYTDFKDRKPTVVVLPKTVESISEVIRFVKPYTDFPFSVKVGGHGAAGYCLNSNGLVLDLTKYFKNVTWSSDNQSVTISGGAVHQDILDSFKSTNKVLIMGNAPTIGFASLLLGGGFSTFSGVYGLACDQLLEATLVLASGDVITVGPGNDLFWALCGGGGGNFGVVVSLKVKTFDKIPYVIGVASWTTSEISQALKLWGEHIKDPQTPRFYNFMIDKTVSNDINFFGYLVEINTTTSAVLEFLNTVKTTNDTQVTATLETEMYFPVESPDFSDYYQYIKSMIIDPNAFTDQFYDNVANSIELLKDVPHWQFSFHNFGKVVNSNSNGAFPHRNRAGVLQLKTFWPTVKDDTDRTLCIQQAQKIWELFETYSKGSYINYIDPLLPNWQQDYYGSNYARLVDVKNSVDPDNFFKFAQSIGN